MYKGIIDLWQQHVFVWPLLESFFFSKVTGEFATARICLGVPLLILAIADRSGTNLIDRFASFAMTVSSALAGLVAGDISVASFVEALIPGPWSIAMLAIQLSGLLSCEQDEQILAMKRDNRLCHSIGSYCSIRIPIIGTCIETKHSYCCFNSRLARILQEQGRAQLGRGWGGAKDPHCDGFSLSELQALDFSRMDLSEFYAEIAPTLPDVSALRQRAQQKMESYFQP
jgi:conjugal transfer mating pair stabilization protein TraN